MASKSYRWIKTPGECPQDEEGSWHIIRSPKYPGVDSYDVATYSITESARFAHSNSAGKMVANNLNRIGAPDVTFGIKGGNWKCDDASVTWSGKYWIATLTWTRSGDSRGWNRELYQGAK